MKKMENSAGLGDCEEATGNRVVDVLLYQKRKMTEEKKIVWECDVQIPKACGISEFDLCVLFGNILDNAVEACEKAERPFIRIRAGAVKNCFLLEVTNSTAADLPEGRAVRKENLQQRGIGLLNVEDVVERYDGAMHVEMRNAVFGISVLIPLGGAVHDMEQAV